MDRRSHWEAVWSKPSNQLSWHEPDPRESLELLGDVTGKRVIDVGGGDSILVDRLLDLAPVALTVLDVSPAALNRAKSRLGARARSVNWIESDVTLIESVGEFDFWHDRAVFHFLTDREDRSGYTELARRSLVPGGCAVIATFAPSGPSQCSALPVIRYDATSLPAEFGDGFELIDYREVRHLTPWGAPQQFSYFKLQKATARNCIAPGWSKPRPD